MTTLASSLTNILSQATKRVSPHPGEPVHHLDEGQSQKLDSPTEICVEKDGLFHTYLAPFGTTISGPLDYTFLRRTPEYVYSKSVNNTPSLNNLRTLFAMGGIFPAIILFIHFLVFPILGQDFNAFYVSAPALLCGILANILPLKLMETTAESRLQTCLVAPEGPELNIELAPELQSQFNAVLSRIEEALAGPLPSAKAAMLRHARQALNDLMAKLQSNAQLQSSPQAITHIQSFLSQTQDRMVPLLEHHQTIALDDLTSELSALNTQLERL